MYYNAIIKLLSLLNRPIDSYILEKAGTRTTVVARSNYEQVKGSGRPSKPCGNN